MITEKDFGFKKEIRTITHPKTGEPHTVYLRESDITLDTKIYRYIDFTYLLDMLKNKKLYVANRASFSDRRDSKGEKASLEEIRNQTNESYQQQLEAEQYEPPKVTKKEAMEVMLTALFEKFFEPLDVQKWNQDKATIHFSELSDMTDTDYVLASMRLNNPVQSYTKEK